MDLRQDYTPYLARLKSHRQARKLPLSEQERIIDSCITCGENAARDILREKGSVDGDSLQPLAESYGIYVKTLDTKYDLPYIAEYTHRNRTIVLYDRRIRQMQQILAGVHPEYFRQYSLHHMCLAHELFHHLESVKNGSTGRIAGIPGKLFGVIPITHWIAEGSEIAAHAFVCTLLDLSINTYTFADEMAASLSSEDKGDSV